MNHRGIGLALGFVAVVIGTSYIADAALARSGEADVAFHAKGPAGMAIKGTTSDLEVAQSADIVSITVPLEHLTTGIGLRDKHMRDKYLEVSRYPSAVLQVRRGSLRIPAGEASETGNTQGKLTLHGTTREVSVHYGVRRTGGRLLVDGSFRIDMRDYGISVPKYLGVTVKPDVDIQAHFGAEDR